jgi:hypothetical protein
MQNWQIGLGAALILILIYMYTQRTKKRTSMYSDVKTKLPADKCPDGYQEIGSTLCGKM